MTSAVDPVAEAHPFVMIRCVDHRCGELHAVNRIASDYEDLDALSIEEQAAIVCSIFASDHGRSIAWWDWEDEGEDHGAVMAGRLSLEAAAIYSGDEAFAEAEARIRNGEVRP